MRSPVGTRDCLRGAVAMRSPQRGMDTPYAGQTLEGVLATVLETEAGASN